MSDTTFDFRQKVAVITGAAGGIGSTLAELLVRSGAHVVLADLDATAVTARAAELSGLAGTAVGVACDTADPDSIDTLVAFTQSEFGRIDALIPSAGIYPESLVIDTEDELWRRVQKINLEGVFLLTKRAIPLMTTGAAIVNLTSVAGHRGSLGHAHYSASKGGLIAFTRSLALELGPSGIRVNAVSPGIIDTAMTADTRATQGEQWIAATPLRRDGTAAEVASTIAFLLSDAASFIHGEVVHVNGGLFLAG
ncbi:SDR family NAD(P)-dependent oxidoreductase [Leucobacter chromiireducens]|uniref:SDR family NAD(P)-dependent oxidoreductase n=1 Tax=Leucobacter chromiireducens TaxID=283877 RepID=UPI000F64439B|nr:SDR family NAD(P)-dependent oxidoreductase [Leucobacter chromiireducens]